MVYDNSKMKTIFIVRKLLINPKNMKSRILLLLFFASFHYTNVNSQNVCLRTNNDFTSNNGAAGVGNPKYIARADFNGDGELDVLTANTTSASVSLFFGNGAGLFTYQDTIAITPSAPTSTPNGIIAADFNNDGDMDFALVKRITSANMNFRVMIGDGTGNFTTYADLSTSTNNPTDLVSGDFDANGTLDVVVLSGASPGTLSFFSNTGSGFSAAVTSTPTGLGLPYYIKAGHFDNDGILDIVFTRDSPGRLVFMKGTGTGTFTTNFNNTIGTGPRDLDLADLDGDGNMDAAVAMNGADSVVISFSNGSGLITSVVKYFSGGDGPQSLAIKDLDADGDKDIVVANLTDFAVGVLYNDGTGNFTLKRFQSYKDPQELVIDDFDSDAFPDIVFTSAGTKTISYMGNDGSGEFINYNNLYDPAVITRPNSSVSLDFNGDGFTDVVAANSTTNTFSYFTGNGLGDYVFNSAIATSATPLSIQAGDYDGNTFNDVAILETAGPSLSIYPGNGAGAFGAPNVIGLSGTPTNLLSYDLDGDSDLDFVIVYNSGAIEIYKNNAGTISFHANYTASLTGPTHVAAGFIDGDNIIDLAICNNGNSRVQIYIGTGGASFTAGGNVTVSAGPDVVSLTDINGDTFLDFIVSYGATASISYALGNGSGGFGGVSNVTVTGASLVSYVIAGDFNLDGFGDVITANNGTADISVLLGSGTGLAYQATFFCGYRPTHMSIGSINSDNLPDIFVSNSDATNGGSSVAAIINRTAVITNSGSTSLCAGQSVTLTSSQSPTTYLWNTGPVTQAILVNSTNAYTVTTTNYNASCTSVSAPENITINLLPTIIGVSGNVTVCSGSSTTLTATSDATTPVITWYDQAVGGTLLNTGDIYNTPAILSNQSYYIEVTDATTGCTSTPRFQVDVTLGDVTSPSYTFCPSNITVAADPGTCSVIVTWSAPTATDNCGVPTVVQTVGLPSGSSFSVGGPYTITYTATDAALNDNECTFTVTVTDTEFPTFTSCPSNISLTNTLGTCGAVATWPAPVASDNCGSPTITQIQGLPSGSTFPVGVTTIKFAATDASLNGDTCTFTVTVVDNQSPSVVSCPSNQTQNVTPGTCGRVVTWTAPTVFDNCSGATIIQSAGLPSGATFPVGVTNISYTATDGALNTATCNFSITIVDNEAPVFASCPANVTVPASAGLCGRVITGSSPTATDNCGSATVTQTSGLISGSTFPIGVTVQTYQATDASGNIATCSYTITVTDGQNPVIVGLPSNMTVTTSASTCSATANWTAPTAIDNCPGVTIVQTAGLPSGSTFPVGVNTITYQATDVNGNIATGSFNVTVVDATPPVFDNCPTNMTACEGDVINFATPTATDNCAGVVTIAQISGPSSGTVFPVGPTTVVFRATDASGNFTNCTFSVTVNSNPVASLSIPSATACENDPILNIDFGSPSGGIYSGNGVSSNSFDPSTSGTGPQTITYTVTNGNGCSAIATDIITVNPAPSVTFTVNDDLACINHGAFTISGGAPGGGTYSGTGVSGNTFTPSTAGSGAHNITYSVTDGNGCTGTAVDVIDVSNCIGIDEVDENNLVVLFPNPSNGLFNIQFINAPSGTISVEVYSTIGQLVYNSTFTNATFQLDLSTLVNGAYMVFIDADGSRIMKKVIIEK